MKILNYLPHQVLSGLLLFCLITTVYAGDEDMNPTAYQRFDPETGFMVPIQQPHEGQQQNNNQATQGTASVDQTPDTPMQPGDADGSTESSSFWIYLLAGVAILAGFAAWVRSKKVKTSPSRLD